MAKVIITAAITGSVHIPTMSEYLPLTPEQIVEDAVKAHAAGAAIAHIHVRKRENGMPTPSPELFREVLGSIRENTRTSSCSPRPAAAWARRWKKNSSPYAR